ncbi:hypothetical protein H5410_058833, partial [Solanum commersonii]
MVTNQGKQYPRSENPNSRFSHINQHQQNFRSFSNPKPASFPLKSGQITPKFKGRKTKFNPNVTCAYCGKLGHIMDNCHRLHGYPDDFEFTKNRNSTYHATSNAAFSNHTGDTGQEQFTPHFNEGLNPSFHASGEVFNSPTWIIDSGASEHMCFDSSFFSSITPLPIPMIISLPNSFKVSVTHIGSVSLLPNLMLNNVLHVPAFKYNLLSIHRLCHQVSCHILFTPTGCLLQDPLMKKQVAFGEVKEGLYLLKSSVSSPSFTSNQISNH